MKQFFKNLDYPFVLFFGYLVKSVVIPNNHLDFAILATVGLFTLGLKLLKYTNSKVDRYFDTKDKVISENEFRVQVSNDIGLIKQEIQALKINSPQSPFNAVGKRR